MVADVERARRWARRLRSAGFEVITTDNGIEALPVTHGDSPDLIVVDHVVGRLDVPHLLARLRGDACRANIPVLVTTTRTDGDLASACRTLGVTLLVVDLKEPRKAVRRKRGSLGSPADAPGDPGSEDGLWADRQSAFREVWEEGVAAGGITAPRGRPAVPRQADLPKGW